jgi:hypothetical protein
VEGWLGTSAGFGGHWYNIQVIHLHVDMLGTAQQLPVATCVLAPAVKSLQVHGTSSCL